MTKNYKKKEPEKSIDLMPIPSAVDVEEIVLGTIILENGLIDKAMQEFNVGLFYKTEHELIAKAIMNLYKSSKPIDIITITQELKRTGELELAGGVYFISTLSNRVASSVNFDYHLKILQESALKRNMINICNKGLRMSFDNAEDIFDTFQDLQNNLENALKSVIHYEIKKVSEIHDNIIAESIEVSKKGIKSGIPSGLKVLDNVTNGWQRSDLIILAGRPSMGKTACAISMIMNPAIEKNIPVGIFSLEMSNQQLVSRMQSSLSEINVSRIVKKQLTMGEIHELGWKSKSLEKAPIYVDDTPNISLIELKSKARKLVKEKGVELIIIDYLQLMRSGLKINVREQEIAEISKGLKGLAKELNIPIIALSQLSRGVEGRQDKKPMLSDLRESGQIEQDADMVMFCYRPEYYGIDSYEIDNTNFDARGLFMLIVAKHRNGELGEIPLRFIHQLTKVTNRPEDIVEDIKQSDTFVQQNSESIKEESIKPNNDFLSSEEEYLPF